MQHESEAEAKNQEGRNLVKAKDFAGARDCFSKAIELHRDPRYFNNRALCNLHLAKYDDAIVDATTAMEGFDPTSLTYGKALQRRLTAYAKLGKWASANLDIVNYLKEKVPYQPKPADLAHIQAIRQSASLYVRRLNAAVLSKVNRWLRAEEGRGPITLPDLVQSWFDDSVEQRLQQLSLPPGAREKLLEAGRIIEARMVGAERELANPLASPSASANDREHLTDIVNCFDFLAQWNRSPPLFLPTDSADFTAALMDAGLTECREGLLAIARSVHLLNRETRQQAYRMMQAPTTCFTIEALGAAMEVLAGYELMITLPDAPPLHRKLHELLLDCELLVDAAIPDILQADLPKMRAVFAHLLSPLDPAPKALRFVATRALVDHLNDARTLWRLRYLSLLLDEPYVPTEVAREVDRNPKAILRKNGPLKRMFDGPTTTRSFRHAAARLLQLIGELLQSLSKRTRALPSLPFDDFEMVRNGLTHPEEHGWDQVSAALLREDDPRLAEVIAEVRSQLPERLLELIAKRWPPDSAISWRQLYDDEERATGRQATPAQVPPAESVQRRGSVGTKATKAERTARKAKEAEERKAKKEAEQEAQRQAQRAARESAGFPLVGALAQEFKGRSSSPPVRLPPIELVRLAHQALQTVHDYLLNEPALRPSLAQNWEQDQTKKQQFYARLCASPELHYAIEFNSGQVAQHLMSLFDGHNSESADTKAAREAIVNILTSTAALGPDTLRTFRNYLAHGEALVDLHDPYAHDGPPVRPRHVIIAPKMARLAITLLPVLRQLLLPPNA